jgi:RNA polymerase sigma-70 factor (ECF subfamily)
LVEKEIIEKCIQGSISDFRKLVSATSPFVYSVAFRMLCNEEEARDVVQDSMIKVWTEIKKVKSPEAFKTWLYRIVVNKCYDQLRKRKTNPEVHADDKVWQMLSEKIEEGTISLLENSETLIIIEKLTHQLSPKQKAVFILSDMEELSNDEICRITGMNRNNVKANLHFARRKIGEMLEKYI